MQAGKQIKNKNNLAFFRSKFILLICVNSSIEMHRDSSASQDKAGEIPLQHFL
jgi:hypothetical protein